MTADAYPSEDLGELDAILAESFARTRFETVAGQTLVPDPGILELAVSDVIATATATPTHLGGVQ